MKRVVGILICLLMLLCAVDLRAQNHSPEQPPDTIPSLAGDSTLLRQPGSPPIDPGKDKVVEGKQDSLRIKGGQPLVEITSDKFLAPSYMFSPSPRKAVLYSAIFPGLGQIYNRKYWKLPILYGGFAALTYAISWNNGYYRDYLVAYQEIMDTNPDTNRWRDLLPYGQTEGSVDTQWFSKVLQQRKDYYRYYRDLSIISTVAVYLLAIVDAYVDAQLFDFDMSPDLSMRMTPVIIGRESLHGLERSSYGVQWSFNF